LPYTIDKVHELCLLQQLPFITRLMLANLVQVPATDSLHTEDLYLGLTFDHKRRSKSLRCSAAFSWGFWKEKK